MVFSLQLTGVALGGLPGMLAATVMYFILRILLQRRAKSFQTAGLKLMAEERFDEAAAMFEAGYEYFSERRWTDRYRAISMLNPSGMDWRESMLANAALNLAMAGEKTRAIELYNHCLELYPNSRIAKPALRMLTAGDDQ